MAAPIAVLRAMLLAGMTTACFDCQGGYYATVQPNFLIAPEGDLVNFTCSTNLMVTYPKWKINDNVYDVTNHPPEITFEGMNIKFEMPQTSVPVRCFISTFIDGEVVDICSNIAITLLPERTRLRRNSDSFPECQKENVTFSNDIEVSKVHISIEHGGDCEVSLNISRCSDPHIEIEAHAMSGGNSSVVVGIDSIETFYGHNVTVTMNDMCDECRERFYLPDMKQTEYKFITKGRIIDDLSNDYGCDFGSQVIEYKICIYSGDSNDCFAHPCGNGQIFTSLCSGSTSSDGTVGLEVGEVENGTVVSIFCPRIDCRGLFSNVLLFNIGILTCEDCNENADCIEGQCVCKSGYTGDGLSCEGVTCDENAEYKEGECVCRENYTGDGIVCRRLAAPPQPRELSLLMHCNVPVNDGRPGVISWMEGERDDEVVYPGAQKAVVKLSPPGNTVCSGVTDTRCTFNITTEDYYTVSLTLTNDAGSSEPVSLSFNPMVFQTENYLRGIRPSVRVTVNEYCSNTNVNVSFGLREKGSNNNCDLQESQSATLAPDVAKTFYVNEAIVMLSDGYEYCFSFSSFQEPSSSPSPEPTSETEEGLPVGAVVIGALSFVLVVVIGFLIVGFFVLRMPYYVSPKSSTGISKREM